MWWKGLGWGALGGILIITVSWLTGNWQLAINSCSMIAIGSLLLAAIMSGAFNTGAIYRANHDNENRMDRVHRREQATWLAMLALPNLIITLILYRCL